MGEICYLGKPLGVKAGLGPLAIKCAAAGTDRLFMAGYDLLL